MQLEFVERVLNPTFYRPSLVPGWPVGSEVGGFSEDSRFTVSWWYDFDLRSDSLVVEGRSEGLAVARLELDDSSSGIPCYEGKPEMFDPLEIVKLEVAADFRRQKVGSSVVATLARVIPNRTLIAMGKETAEPFWDSLGWVRCLNPEHRGLGFPYYVQPRPGFGGS